jgi:Family of unknown function (DUF5320)
MPGRDGTGPLGLGPLTGGRRGYCAGAVQGTGRGHGRGWRNQFYATGLTGWQRAAHGAAQPADVYDAPGDPFARLENRLAEVLERLDRLEAGQK